MTKTLAPQYQPHDRFAAVDALRGAAMLWMTAYHLAFDLNHFGYIRQNFYADPVWTWQRAAIVSLFVFTAGVSQALAAQQGQSWRRFSQRWGQIAGCALLVSAASYLMYPKSFIYFGVLHGLALMLIVARLLAPWGRRHELALVVLGALAVAAPHLWALAMGASDWAALFNASPLNALGLITRKPITEDYVPLLPWLGLMLWGLAAGPWLLRQRPGWLACGGGGMAWLGRWSLSYYMLHQPVLMGALMLVGLLAKG